jgi:hypothetical protein
VTKIADGESGGVMMNEFPEAFRQSHRRLRDNGDDCIALNGTEYLAQLDAAGIDTSAYPIIQAVGQS